MVGGGGRNKEALEAPGEGHLQPPVCGVTQPGEEGLCLPGAAGGCQPSARPSLGLAQQKPWWFPKASLPDLASIVPCIDNSPHFLAPGKSSCRSAQSLPFPSGRPRV